MTAIELTLDSMVFLNVLSRELGADVKDLKAVRLTALKLADHEEMGRHVAGFWAAYLEGLRGVRNPTDGRSPDVLAAVGKAVVAYLTEMERIGRLGTGRHLFTD
jgi:hypothetical protein